MQSQCRHMFVKNASRTSKHTPVVIRSIWKVADVVFAAIVYIPIEFNRRAVARNDRIDFFHQRAYSLSLTNSSNVRDIFFAFDIHTRCAYLIAADLLHVSEIIILRNLLIVKLHQNIFMHIMVKPYLFFPQYIFDINIHILIPHYGVYQFVKETFLTSG